MKMNKTFIALVATSTLFASSGVFAFGHKDSKCNMGGEQALLKQLELTEAQQKQISDIQDKNMAAKQASVKADAQAFKDSIKNMNQVVYADKFDEAKAREVAQAGADRSVKAQVEKAKGRYDMLQVLTPEQRTQYQELETKNTQACIDAFQEKKAKWEKRLSSFKSDK